MLNSVMSTVFIPMVLIQMVDGTELQAVGDAYMTMDACIVQAEHDAKVMAREIEGIECELETPVIKHVSITCEEMSSTAYPDHIGYLPLEEAYSERR